MSAATDPAVLLAGPQGAQLRLGLAIKQAEQAMMAAKVEALRGLDLTVPQYAVLLQLAEKADRSGAQLARGAAVTPQTMAGVLANLEAKGLIGRQQSEVHGKVMLARLTTAGERLVAEADGRAVGVEAALWSAFEPEEREQLRTLLHRAAAALQR
ncbi:MarR family winged helix-turn-helix transcriptional regulator [Kitasatospora sp. NPDC096147]|uniref:MarR family winged helix-turn-helix transcriptional regulator n=1 Tax=Kitasatospora sp. NPDC096147 TaxID=3364093 RepID=UPI0037FF441C